MIKIGRSTENDVVLYSAVVSRHHVELRHTDAGWEIVNLGTNGTYLDGKRVAQAPAEDGVVIRLARSGPNIQINIKQEKEEKDSLKALRKLQEDFAARGKASAQEVSSDHTTEIHSTDIDAQPSDDTPTSGNAAPPGS